MLKVQDEVTEKLLAAKSFPHSVSTCPHTPAWRTSRSGKGKREFYSRSSGQASTKKLKSITEVVQNATSLPPCPHLEVPWSHSHYWGPLWQDLVRYCGSLTQKCWGPSVYFGPTCYLEAVPLRKALVQRRDGPPVHGRSSLILTALLLSTRRPWRVWRHMFKSSKSTASILQPPCAARRVQARDQVLVPTVECTLLARMQ